MRNCNYCGQLAHFYCLDCHAYACLEDISITRKAWASTCQGRPESHAFVPIIQIESGDRALKASNPDMAIREGRKFGVLLSKIFMKNPELKFEDASALAQYVAIDVLGYRDAEIANAYTQGFISAITETQTPDELSDQYASGMISLEQFNKFIQKAIQAPKE